MHNQVDTSVLVNWVEDKEDGVKDFFPSSQALAFKTNIAGKILHCQLEALEDQNY